MTPKQLRSKRKKNGLRANFIAEKLGLHPARLCEMESGKIKMPQEITEKYQQLLGV